MHVLLFLPASAVSALWSVHAHHTSVLSPALHSPAAGTLFVERGTIVTVSIICYALTSFVGG